MIELKKVSFAYDDQAVLEDIDISIGESEYIAVIGANGSGKTTLAKHFNALLLPAKGSVMIDSLDTKKHQENARKQVGYVFQNPEDQLVNSIVEEDIAFGLENLGIKTGEMKSRVREIMNLLGISHLAKQNVNMLSLGQKQLTALAGVLVMKPKYIVFDEPTTMLDSRNKKNILDIIKNLNKKGIGIILITNIISDIRDSSRIIVLKKGKILFDGKRPMLNKKTLWSAGLDA